MTISDIQALQALTDAHPRMKWTHLYNPVAYTQATPLRDEMEAYVIESRDRHGAEIGLHLHMYHSFVIASGASFQSTPSIIGPLPGCGGDPSGYLVPISSYESNEIAAMLGFSQDLFASRDIAPLRTFCGGVYAASVDLQHQLAAHGFTTSAAAFPGGTIFGAAYAGCWHSLAGWGTEISHAQAPYPVTQDTILPGGLAPYLMSDSGPLIEVPQTCKIDWMVSANDMKAIFDIHRAIATAGTPTAVCFSVHEVSASEAFAKFNTVLTYVDSFIDRPSGPPVIYTTAQEVREAFLPPPPVGDLSGDYVVDALDLAALLGAWGTCGDPRNCAEDLNDDGIVGPADLALLLGAWG